MTQPAVNTRRAARRTLRFNSLDDLEAELDRLQHAHAAGALRATGNWTPGQILQHLGAFWSAAIDGFPPQMKLPAPVVLTGRLFFKRKALTGATTPAGFRFPASARPAFEPAPATTFEEGLAHLRAQIARTRRGERFGRPSPLFGRLGHDEWERLQLGHCQLHLGFLHAEEGSGTPPPHAPSQATPDSAPASRS